MEDIKYTWVPFFEELFDKICIENSPKNLYDLWLRYFPEKYKTYTNENPVSIEKMDPLTFVGKILSLGNERLFHICADLKDIYDLSSDVPMDFAGIPRIERNNPTFWDEAWIGTKSPDDAYFNQVIDNLWLFAKNLNQINENNRNIDEGLIKTILSYRNIAIPKLSQIMFIVKPNIFYSCDGKSLLYINYKLKNNQDFNEFLEIQKISSETGKTPYELSLQAELNKPVDINKNFKKLKWWEITALAMYINNPDAKYTEANIIELDLIRKAMEIKQLASPPSVGTEMRELSNSSTDYKRKNEYFVRYEEGYVKYSLNDNGKKYVETKLKDYIQEFNNKGEWFPKDYTPEFSIDDWVNILQNPRIFDNNSLKLIKRMYDIGGQASCKQLAVKYGLSYSAYIGYAAGLGQRIYRETNCPLLTTDNENSKWWVIPFIGRGAYKQEVGTYVWKLRNELQSAIEKVDLSQIELYENGENKMNIPLNQILYGPPGTGKTYNTVIKAMEIINPSCIEYDEKGVVSNYSDVKNEFDKVRDNHQIEFITFHQSYSYEEFVEGIKPDLDTESWNEPVDKLTYKGSNGIFKTIANRALFERLNIQIGQQDAILDFKNLKEMFIEEYSVGSTFKTGTKNAEFRIDKYTKDSARITPTNGKYTYSITFKYLEEAYNKKMTSQSEIATINGVASGLSCYYFAIYEKLLKIKKSNDNNQVKSNMNEMSDEDKLQLVRDYYEGKIKLNNNKISKPYVLIIDEINRGNISKIFGELITLIEEDKRENMSVKLPYSQEKFTVPKNLYIIGTMNTSDRSIASIDIALRRRFKFKEMMPNSDLVADFGIGFNTIFDDLNNKIKLLLDRDHQIGHSYFINTKYNNSNGNNNVETLKDIWFSEILPLLNEYFYCDWEKLKLIIPGFIKKLDVPEVLKNECDDSIYEFKTFDEVEYFEKALNQEKFEQV